MFSSCHKISKYGLILSPCLKIGLNIPSVRYAGSNYTARQSRMLKKFMTGSNRSRKKFFTVDQSASKSLEEFSFTSNTKSLFKRDKSAPVKPIPRVERLNTVFMEYITGMMATGDVSDQLVGLGIEVTRVKIKNDFSCVNVYWAAKGLESDEVVEKALRMAAGQLRHECSKLRVIGVVPPIHFVKDKTFSKVMEVETLLAKCDFGEDFIPTASPSLFNQSKPTLPQLNPGLNQDLTLQIDNILKGLQHEGGGGSTFGEYSDRSVENVQINFTTDANMRQDIFGLNRERIMETVLRGMNRKQEMLADKQKFADSTRPVAREDDNPMEIELTSAAEISQQAKEDKQRALDFSKYLKKRMIFKAKEIEALSTAAKDREFYESEKELRWLESQRYEEDDDDVSDVIAYEDEIQQTYDDYIKQQ